MGTEAPERTCITLVAGFTASDLLKPFHLRKKLHRRPMPRHPSTQFSSLNHARNHLLPDNHAFDLSEITQRSLNGGTNALQRQRPLTMMISWQQINLFWNACGQLQALRAVWRRQHAASSLEPGHVVVPWLTWAQPACWPFLSEDCNDKAPRCASCCKNRRTRRATLATAAQRRIGWPSARRSLCWWRERQPDALNIALLMEVALGTSHLTRQTSHLVEPLRRCCGSVPPMPAKLQAAFCELHQPVTGIAT